MEENLYFCRDISILMLKKLSIASIFLAMLMVMFTTCVPHHHHQTMICLVQEICLEDGCCDDEHTHHSDANHDEDESHCVAHEKYCPSDNLRVDYAPTAIVLPEPLVHIPASIPAAVQGFVVAGSKPQVPPPILTWRINC